VFKFPTTVAVDVLLLNVCPAPSVNELNPDTSNMAPPATLMLAVLEIDPPLPKARQPAFMVVPPEYGFAPVIVRVPAPEEVSPLVPAITA
jgi:hypothetical protein